MPHHRELTGRIIGLAIEVHRHTGPRLQESVYAAPFCDELPPFARSGTLCDELAPFATNWRILRRTGALCDELEQAAIPAIHQGKPLPLGFRADILADETVILEIKAVPALLRAHDTNRPG